MARKRSGLVRLRTLLMTGILTVSPVAISAYVLYRLFMWLDQLLRHAIEKVMVPLVGRYYPGIGFLALLLLLLLIGLVARLYLGGKLIQLGDWIVSRIPLMAGMTRAVRQILESFLKGNRDLFRQAVLFEYPRKGLYAVGFVTSTTRGEISEKLQDSGERRELVSVFVPTTPNPTSGVLVFVARRDAIFLDMSVEDALKLVVSAGALNPDTQAHLVPQEKGDTDILQTTSQDAPPGSAG